MWLSKSLNLTVDQLIELHSNSKYQVFFIGFQPGFAYLHGLDTRIHQARIKHHCSRNSATIQ
ncbi:MAG: carboxyltransferase domain-containing protein [bacterium]